MPTPPDAPVSSLREYIVAQGESIASIAAKLGQTFAAIWDDPSNAELKALREDPYVLLPGDRVMVPAVVPGSFALTAGQRHVFRRQATHTDFQVTCTHNGKPRANLGFVLTLDGDTADAIEGVSDGQGTVRARIPALAQGGMLEFEDGRGRIAFRLGALDPIDTLSGVQGRLQSLGFYAQGVDGVPGPHTARGVRAFQQARGLPITGEIDDVTTAALREAYGR